MAAAQLTFLGSAADDRGQEASRDASSEMQRMSPRQIWFILRRNLKLVSLIVGICTVTVLLMQLRRPNVYEATTTVQVELNDATGTNQADAARNQQRVANEARIYRSPALAEQIVRDLRLDQNERFTGGLPLTFQQTADKLGASTQVISTNDSDFLDIVVRTGYPELSARIANRYVESLQKLRAARRQHWREGLTRALYAERNRLAVQLEEAERDVANYRRSRGMLIGAGGAEDYQQINRIAVEAASAAAQDAASAARAASVNSASRMRSLASATSPVLQQLQRQYDDLLRERSQLDVALGANHPDMQRVRAQIDQVGADMERERRTVIANERATVDADSGRERTLAFGEANAAAARAGQLQGRLKALSTNAFGNTVNNVDLAVLDRRVETFRQAYTTTAQRAQTVRSEPETTGVNSTLVSAAVVPSVPVAPSPKKAAVAAFTGSLMLSLLVVFAIEMLDNRLRSVEQMRALFGLPTLALLPKAADDARGDAAETPVPFDEVARNLALEIGDLPHEGERQSVLVTSPLPGDKKADVALAIANAATALGRRAIVVDLDLRHPGSSVLRRIQNETGGSDLSDYIEGRAGFDRLLQERVGTDAAPAAAPRATVLSTREPVRDPASLVQGPQGARIAGLLDELRHRFDLVIINAPAVLAVRDARTLATLADSAIMVVLWGRTTIEQMRAALQLMQNTVAGAIFNQVDYRDHARRGYGDAVEFYMNSTDYYADPVNDDAPWTQRAKRRLRTLLRSAA